jgi:transcription elongation factor GreA
MSILLTKECHTMLVEKLQHMKFVEQPSASKLIDECRQIGALDDNTEYYTALENADRLNKKINDLVDVLNQAIVFTESMKVDDTVGFGTTVEFINCDTDVKKKYTIVSVYDSNLDNGLISIDAPFVKEMLGLHTGDFFSFNDIDYEITNIYYSF